MQTDSTFGVIYLQPNYLRELPPADRFICKSYVSRFHKQVDDYEALPCYPYRDDAILLHHVIWDYVREVLEGHYGEWSMIYEHNFTSFYFITCTKYIVLYNFQPLIKMIISHVIIYGNFFTCDDYRWLSIVFKLFAGQWDNFYIINRIIRGCLGIGNLFPSMKFISRVNTRNKFHICAHPCMYYSLSICIWK